MDSLSTLWLNTKAEIVISFAKKFKTKNWDLFMFQRYCLSFFQSRKYKNYRKLTWMNLTKLNIGNEALRFNDSTQSRAAKSTVKITNENYVLNNLEMMKIKE